MSRNCARCYECYSCFNCVDSRYCWNLTPSKECVSSMDLTGGGIGERLYNSTDLGGGNYYERMCASCRQSANLTYCIECYSCRDCFGCIGLRHKQYCILNRQYSAEQYQALVTRIIAHMEATGEWGAFFPPALAPLPYNDSYAAIFFPLEKQEVLNKGWPWEESTQSTAPDEIVSPAPPDKIADTDSAICRCAFHCAASGKAYRIIEKELEFYRKMMLPLPRFHPDVRMSRRRAQLNPFRLWTRQCAKCGKKTASTYAPGRPEAIYCEDCYLVRVY